MVPSVGTRRPLISFPPPLPHPRTCLLVTGKNSAAPERTFRSALVSAEWRAQRENDRREERGIWAGHSKRIVGSTSQRFFNQRIVRCIVYRRSTLAAHSFPSLRRFLTLEPACWPREIHSFPTRRSSDLSSPQNGGPKGKMIEGRSGGSGRGTRKEL